MSNEIRTILPEDDKELAKIIRDTLTEFGVARPGTVYYDEATDHLSEVFTIEGSIYFVAMQNDRIVGGAGVFPTNGLPEGTCELVKMYLIPEVRGIGLGKILIEKCFEFAIANGYKQMYLESLPELKTAIAMYEKYGFAYLKEPLGNTGHFGCDVRMIKEL